MRMLGIGSTQTLAHTSIFYEKALKVVGHVMSSETKSMESHLKTLLLLKLFIVLLSKLGFFVTIKSKQLTIMIIR